MGIKSEASTEAKAGTNATSQAKTQVKTENQMEAQANLDIASQLEPDVYGPNGDNYENKEPTYDYSRIKIDISDPGTGEKCSEGNWASAHWVANLQVDGRVYSDTKQEGNGEP